MLYHIFAYLGNSTYQGSFNRSKFVVNQSVFFLEYADKYSVLGDNQIFSVFFRPKRIVPQNIYLMVEAGVEKDGIVEFPYLLKHEEGEFDCIFASLCKQGGFTCLPNHLLEECFKAQYRKIIKLRHLSSETIMFIDPGEEFSEDVTLKLNKGIYKATVVWTSVKEDCICGTKQFIIE